MLLRFRVIYLLTAMLLAGVLLSFAGGRAEAKEMLASWYGPGFQGLPTASGTPYDASGYTAAHKTLPLGTELAVSYGGKTVEVTVNDRGPYVGDRELDLSQGAAQALGLTHAGVDYVSVSGGGTVSGGASAASSGSYSGETSGSYSASYTSGDSSAYTGASSGSSGGSDVYVVQSGDTLSEVALQLGVSAGYLARYNGIADPDFIYTGQALHY